MSDDGLAVFQLYFVNMTFDHFQMLCAFYFLAFLNETAFVEIH